MRLGEDGQSHGGETVTQEELFAEMDAYRESVWEWWKTPLPPDWPKVASWRNILTNVETRVRLSDGKVRTIDHDRREDQERGTGEGASGEGA